MKLKIIITVFTILLLSFGCGTKKKTTSSEKTEIKKEVLIDSTAGSKVEVKKEVKASTEDKKTSVKKEIEYDGVEGDSLTITEKGPDGKVLSETVIKGKGKVKIKDAKETSETQKNEIQNFDYNSWSHLLFNKKADETYSHQKAEATKTKTGITLGFWSWFWIVIVIIIILSKWKNHLTRWLNIKSMS